MQHTSYSHLQHALILDDHFLFASSFSFLLKDIFRFKKISLCSSFEDVEQHLAMHSNISYLFTDYMMPDVNTFGEMERIRRLYPELKIVIISSVTNEHVVSRLIRSGANAFLSKNAQNEDVIDCIGTVESGHVYISKKIRDNIVINFLEDKKKTMFSLREHEVLQYIADGNTIEETAQKMNLSPNTVITHRKNMMRKMDVSSVTALLKAAMEMGLI